MALAPIGIFDLSLITDRLITLVTQCRDASPLWAAGPPFTLNITGLPPDVVRDGANGGTQLSIYLFHATPDRFQRNAPPGGPVGAGTAPVRLQPFGLDLYYLVTAFDKANYVNEQQAMSIALRCFHDAPIVRTTVTLDGQAVNEEFCVTMEVESSDELGRLWQAVTSSLRLSAVFKVSVVFLTPEKSTVAVTPNPTQVGLAVLPTGFPFAATGHLLGTVRTVRYRSPAGTAAAPDIRSFDASPALAAAGARLHLYGEGLDQVTSRRVYLITPTGAEQEVTAWIVAPQPPPPPAARYTLQLPAAVGAAPAQTPPAGVYQLRVGSDTAQGDPVTTRSNATPFSIAARVDVTADPPILAAVAGLFSITGAGFMAGTTEVLLDTVPLAESAGAPAAGEFAVGAGGTTLDFRTPSSIPPGRYTVRVRVNGVESPPAWWVTL